LNLAAPQAILRERDPPVTDLTCRDFVEFIAAHVEGDLDAEERIALEEHLSECTDCVAYLASYQETIALGKAALDADGPVPEDVPPRLIEAILKARRRGR
jgi:anti-sigma factor RsiW